MPAGIYSTVSGRGKRQGVKLMYQNDGNEPLTDAE